MLDALSPHLIMCALFPFTLGGKCTKLSVKFSLDTLKGRQIPLGEATGLGEGRREEKKRGRQENVAGQ